MSETEQTTGVFTIPATLNASMCQKIMDKSKDDSERLKQIGIPKNEYFDVTKWQIYFAEVGANVDVDNKPLVMADVTGYDMTDWPTPLDFHKNHYVKGINLDSDKITNGKQLLLQNAGTVKPVISDTVGDGSHLYAVVSAELVKNTMDRSDLPSKVSKHEGWKMFIKYNTWRIPNYEIKGQVSLVLVSRESLDKEWAQRETKFVGSGRVTELLNEWRLKKLTREEKDKLGKLTPTNNAEINELFSLMVAHTTSKISDDALDIFMYCGRMLVNNVEQESGSFRFNGKEEDYKSNAVKKTKKAIAERDARLLPNEVLGTFKEHTRKAIQMYWSMTTRETGWMMGWYLGNSVAPCRLGQVGKMVVNKM